jgi:hypothetical protein
MAQPPSSPQREARKIIDLVNDKLAKDEVFFSFEYFPPRTDQGLDLAFSLSPILMRGI